jgi:hypothetical protein
MTYQALRLGLCGQQLHIPKNTIREHVVQLTGRRVDIVKTVLDTAKCRGFYLSPQNVEHPFVKILGRDREVGNDVIVVAQGMNRCWDRFVIVKELMHMFDKPNEATDTGEKFDQLLSDFGASQSPPSPQGASESNAFWMAMGALCPESHRQPYVKLRLENKISDYDLALKFRIPEQFVPHLFHQQYTSQVEKHETNLT